MIPDELINKVLGLYAYDGGSTDSGIRDNSLKASLKGREDIEELLTACAKALCEPPYTIEDVTAFCKWIRDELGIYY